MILDLIRVVMALRSRQFHNFEMEMMLLILAIARIKPHEVIQFVEEHEDRIISLLELSFPEHPYVFTGFCQAALISTNLLRQSNFKRLLAVWTREEISLAKEHFEALFVKIFQL